MKNIIFIIFIATTVCSFNGKTLYEDSTEVESLSIDLLSYQSTEVNMVTYSASEEHINNIFSGMWMNENKQTGSITKFNIRNDNNLLYIQVWGACTPSDCDWGEHASDEVEKGTKKFDLFWDQGFVERTLTFEIIDGKLQLTEQSHYKDNSDRPDFTNIEYFIKQ